MLQISKLKTLSAVSLVCAVLAGCGGGDAEAPPPPVGAAPPSSAPDTTAPTVTIANNVSAPTATGPVTFTFVFSEDVGVSFEAGEITVTGGSASGFSRVSGSQATVVVTPTANATGTMTVSVAAGSFTDIAGNANTAAANAQKPFDTVVPATPGNTGTCSAPNCIDFADVAITFGPFENQGGGTVGIDNDPLNASNKVARFVKKPGDGDFFGTTIGGFAGPVTLTANNKTVTLRVLSPRVGVNYLLKFEGGTGGPAVTEKDVASTVAGAWETLSFVMPDAGTFTTVVLFPNGRSSVQADTTMYVDELKFPASGGSACSAPACVDFSASGIGFGPFENQGGGTVAIGNDPTDAANKVVQFVKKPGDGAFFGTTITGLGVSPVLTANNKTVTMRVYSPVAGTNFLLKFEGGTGGPATTEKDAVTTTANAWETLSFDMPDVGTFSTIVVFPNGRSTVTADKTMYIDDLRFPATAGSGGGGGSTGPQTFSSGLAGGNRTIEGGEFGGFSGSNQDSFACSGDPVRCGSGGNFNPAIAAADSFFFYYYQTPTPATDLYMGIFVLAPGLTGGLSGTADSTGIQINGQTSIKFKLGQNPEWFGTATNKFAVDLTLGKRFPPNGNTCRQQLRTIVTPTAAAATAYTVPLSAFSLVQDCGVGGATVASALAASPISQVSFQGVGGGIALTAGGQTSGANLSVAAGGVYPTTLVIVGGITFE